MRQIKRNIAIPARAIGDDRPYKIVLFPVDVSDKFPFIAHPTVGALRATPLQRHYRNKFPFTVVIRIAIRVREKTGKVL
ncbi:MAG: hypothetical protein FWB85_11690 [Chitinispirillia bacterium]|nr:hypothetical protein [Chitinispirillia bacterium]MCL2242754.1 hypothetical protein [Chitinispirillia bacterium]